MIDTSSLVPPFLRTVQASGTVHQVGMCWRANCDATCTQHPLGSMRRLPDQFLISITTSACAPASRTLWLGTPTKSTGTGGPAQRPVTGSSAAVQPATRAASPPCLIRNDDDVDFSSTIGPTTRWHTSLKEIVLLRIPQVATESLKELLFACCPSCNLGALFLLTGVGCSANIRSLRALWA